MVTAVQGVACSVVICQQAYSVLSEQGDFQPVVLESKPLQQCPHGHVHDYWLNSCITNEQSKTCLVCLGFLWWHHHIHA